MMKQVARKSTALGGLPVDRRLVNSSRVSSANSTPPPPPVKPLVQNGYTSSPHDDAAVASTSNGVVHKTGGPADTEDYEVTIVDTSDEEAEQTNGSKRPMPATNQSKNKRCRVDCTKDNKQKVSCKELTDCIAACFAQCTGTNRPPSGAHIFKKIQQLEESRSLWRNKTMEFEQRLSDLSARCVMNSAAHVTRSASMSNIGTTVNQSNGLSPSKFAAPSRSVPNNTTSATSRQAVSRQSSPTKQPANAVVLRNRPIVANVVASTSGLQSVSSSVNSSSGNKSVIDLTDDDEVVQQQTVVMRPLTLPQALFNRGAILTFKSPAEAAAALAGGLPTNRLSSTAVVKPLPPQPGVMMHPPPFVAQNHLTHPAPLPVCPTQPNAPPTAKRIPAKPTLKLSRIAQGIVLSWNMPNSADYEPATQYQLYAYQQGQEPPSPALWKKVGNVEALPLPMACTLTQFQVGNRYHFAVRAIDCHGRLGMFSEPGSIHLESMSA